MEVGATNDPVAVIASLISFEADRAGSKPRIVATSPSNANKPQLPNREGAAPF